MPAYKYVFKNYVLTRDLYKSGEINKYTIIHLNRPETLLLADKIPNQILIVHIHGFDIGILGKNYLKDIHNIPKKFIGYLFDKFIENKIKEKINLADIFYCSTPDLIEPIEDWCKRKPTWLPNPIDTEIFSPNGPVIKLPGEPACFLAARLHGDKKPEIAIEIFKNYIKPRYKNATLHLLNIGELVGKYKKELSDPKTYFWHDFMDKKTLASKIRGADLVFGDFSIGALSLLPMQVMAAKKPIITLDKYEIVKKDLDELPALTLKILEDDFFAKLYVEKNYDYIVKYHSQEAVSKAHLDNIRKVIK
jgi:glycosyltransferase involved in cell wall biosynthesis